MKTISLILLTIGFVVTAHANNGKTDSTLTEYTGRYTFPQGAPTPEARIALDQGALYITSQIGTSTLQRLQGDLFSLVEYNGTAEFSRNEKGKVVKVHVVVQDIDVVGTKDESGWQLDMRPLRMLPKFEPKLDPIILSVQ